MQAQEILQGLHMMYFSLNNRMNALIKAINNFQSLQLRKLSKPKHFNLWQVANSLTLWDSKTVLN
jgi:hypothetical protein